VAARLTHSVSAVAGRISVLGGSYTFGSKSGSIPLTVDNELDQAVTVQIALRTDNARLRVRSVGPVRVEARRKTQIVLPATGRANGRVLVTAQLLTPDGRALGSPARLDVHITRYGTLALIVTGGAAALLFALAGARTLRRVRVRARTTTATSGGDPDEGSGPGELREEHVVR
jgi:Family of unknown function (DUF6049)